MRERVVPPRAGAVQAGRWHTGGVIIEIDDLSRPAVHALLAAHLAAMHAGSPACSVHALPLDALRDPA
ncbi:hypothetical protein [Demequina litorisediminis]|uniref:Uncharacterized protein n=1 Tax=Demequina litorisediminis TaxID=1849022 RepID=A0ABQ6IEX2_9MICO|nr:hypothetical protein GCM10025876_14830 [Demequina litorisediminis]